MRRYWQRIDYSKIKKQKPHKPLEFQKTKFDDVPLSEFVFDNLPDDIIRMVLRRKRKLQLRMLFLEKNYIKIKKNFQKDSKKNRNFKFYRKFHIVYFLYIIYYNLDAILYYFQLFFGYLGDKKFRKFVRKVASFRYFKHFRLFLYMILYYSISLPIRFFIYQKFYHFIRFVFHKRWLHFKQKILFEIEDRTSKVRGNFWYDYNQKVSEQKKKIFATYFEMYTYPYRQYYKGWRKWVVRFRESGAFFIIEFQDLYAYFAGLSFVTWVVEFYYIIYNVIFFFYPFVLPFFFFLPFFFLTKYYLLDSVNSLNTLFFVSFSIYFVFVCIIFTLITIEITKYYLVKMSVEAVNWYSLSFVAKIKAACSCFKHFFFRTKFHEITLKRIRSRFFYYHEATPDCVMSDKNAQYIEKDLKRKNSFFKRKKLYPKLFPRYWCQYGKCLYQKQIYGFRYVKNIFASCSEFIKFKRIYKFNSNKKFLNKTSINIFNFLFLQVYRFFLIFFGISGNFLFLCFLLLFFMFFSFIFSYKVMLIFVLMFLFYSYKSYYTILLSSCSLSIYFMEKMNLILHFFYFFIFFDICCLISYLLISILF